MVLIAFVILTALAGLWVGLKTEPFNIMGAIGTWGIGALLSVVALGMLSWHSEQQVRTYAVNDYIPLTRGLAVDTSGGGFYIGRSVTTFINQCEEPFLEEIKNKTRPYLLFVTVTTSTSYTLCIPN